MTKGSLAVERLPLTVPSRSSRQAHDSGVAEVRMCLRICVFGRVIAKNKLSCKNSTAPITIKRADRTHLTGAPAGANSTAVGSRVKHT
jgi:hypothetical protein